MADHDVDLSRLNVLIVEDDDRGRKLIRQILLDLGVGLIFDARNGRDGQSRLEEAGGLINFIICDWMMPEMTGIDFLKHVRKVAPGIPFLMVTAKGTIDAVIEAKKIGVDAFVVKPYTLVQLEEKILHLARKSFLT